jgi:hypothetical protein
VPNPGESATAGQQWPSETRFYERVVHSDRTAHPYPPQATTIEVPPPT